MCLIILKVKHKINLILRHIPAKFANFSSSALLDNSQNVIVFARYYNEMGNKIFTKSCKSADISSLALSLGNECFHHLQCQQKFAKYDRPLKQKSGATSKEVGKWGENRELGNGNAASTSHKR